MRVFLDQLGCRLNFSENSILAGRLNEAGHRIVGRPEDAQVIVLNTCAVTSQAARKSRQAARHLNKRNPAARIAMTGCYATLAPQESASLPGVELVADNHSKEMLHTLLEPWSAEFSEPDDLSRIQPHGTPFAPASPEEEGGRTRAFVKIQDGCQNRCTFCIVTALRGDSRSRTTADVVREVQALVDGGYREAVLTGVHLGAFGRDLPGRQRTDLKELTAAILTDTDIARLRLSSLEPWELADGFFDLWQRWPGRLCPHLHLPLQAGFPGESDADYEEGLRFVEEMRFAHAHIFPFSARTGTAAADFDGQVTKTVKRERSRRMHQAVARTGQLERTQYVGATRPVLWEGAGRQLTDQADTLLWSGLTDNYLRVTAQAPGGTDISNRITPVRLEELHGETLYGEPLLQ